MPDPSPNPERLRTVAQFLEACPGFTPGGIRSLIFNAEANGLHRALVRVGRRVYVDLDRFGEWLTSQPTRKKWGLR